MSFQHDITLETPGYPSHIRGMKNEILLKVVLFAVILAIFVWIVSMTKPECPPGSHAEFSRTWVCEARP